MVVVLIVMLTLLFQLLFAVLVLPFELPVVILMLVSTPAGADVGAAVEAAVGRSGCPRNTALYHVTQVVIVNVLFRAGVVASFAFLFRRKYGWWFDGLN